MTETMKKHGGAREGAGRKTTGTPGKSCNLNFRISPEEKTIIDAKAKAAGKTTSRFMIDLALST